MYRTCSELAEKKDETDQLLGLMKDKEDKQDEFNYNDEDEDEIPNLDDGVVVVVVGGVVVVAHIYNTLHFISWFPYVGSLRYNSPTKKCVEKDALSNYSAHSMLSLHSNFGTSLHENVISFVILKPYLGYSLTNKNVIWLCSSIIIILGCL